MINIHEYTKRLDNYCSDKELDEIVEDFYNDLHKECIDEYKLTQNQFDMIWCECYERWHSCLTDLIYNAPSFAEWCSELIKDKK